LLQENRFSAREPDVATEVTDLTELARVVYLDDQGSRMKDIDDVLKPEF